MYNFFSGFRVQKFTNLGMNSGYRYLSTASGDGTCTVTQLGL